MFRIDEPVHTRNVNVGFGAGVHHARFSALQRSDQNPDDGIGAAGGGITLHLRFAAGRGKIHQRILRDLAFVHFQISDRRGIRRPPVRRFYLQFFGIHPVKLPFADIFRAALRKCAFFPVGEIHEPEVVIADEADLAAVRRNLRIADRRFAGNQNARCLRFQMEPAKRRGALK